MNVQWQYVNNVLVILTQKANSSAGCCVWSVWRQGIWELYFVHFFIGIKLLWRIHLLIRKQKQVTQLHISRLIYICHKNYILKMYLTCFSKYEFLILKLYISVWAIKMIQTLNIFCGSQLISLFKGINGYWSQIRQIGAKDSTVHHL